jgi:hypothetical protein
MATGHRWFISYTCSGLLFVLLMGGISGRCQSFSIGCKAGVPLTEDFSNVQLPSLHFDGTTNRYIIGPEVQVNLPFGFAGGSRWSVPPFSLRHQQHVHQSGSGCRLRDRARRQLGNSPAGQISVSLAGRAALCGSRGRLGQTGGFERDNYHGHDISWLGFNIYHVDSGRAPKVDHYRFCGGRRY